MGGFRGRLTRGITVVLMITAMTACAPADDEAAPASSVTLSTEDCSTQNLAVRTPGTLTIGTDSPAYEPWFMNDDPSNGQGFESAVAYAVAEQLGFDTDHVTWVTASFNSVIKPGPKDFDVAINQVSITDERKESVDFSSGYYDVTQAVVATADSPIANVTSLAELQSAKLGAQVGTTSYTTITNVIRPRTEPAVYDRNDDAKVALMNGQIDGLVVDLPTALYLAAAEIDGGKVVGQIETSGGAPEQFGLVLDLGSPLTACVTGAVDALRADGSLEQLETTWLTDSAGAPVLR